MPPKGSTSRCPLKYNSYPHYSSLQLSVETRQYGAVDIVNKVLVSNIRFLLKLRGYLTVKSETRRLREENPTAARPDRLQISRRNDDN